MPILWRMSLRGVLRGPLQAALSVLGVALGVAVVVSIDLANQSAERAFQLSTEAISGRATHQVVGGPSGVPEAVYRQLRVERGVRPSAPIVEGDVTLFDRPGRAFHLLGVDPFAEEPFRPYLAPAGEGVDISALMTRRGAVLVSEETAMSLGVGPGDTIALRVGGDRRDAIVVGTVVPADELSRRALENLIVADIATAQELLGMTGRLSRIDLIVTDDASLAWIGDALPPGFEITTASARTATMEQMTRAFRLNLTALSLLALVFGMFLIYNSMTFSVVRRRARIGTIRALGVTRGEVISLILGEAILVGALGTAAGLAVGDALGRGLVDLVTQTISDLYFALSVREVATPASVLVKGAVLGLGATVTAALVPALEAAGAPPRATLSRAHLEERARVTIRRATTAGLGLLAVGALLLLVPSRSVVLGFAALFAIVIGLALLTPAATTLSMRLLLPLVSRFTGMVGRMAVRGVVASLSRTAPAMAALVIAVAVSVGLGIMIGSFRLTVERWLGQTLQADVYVSTPSIVASRADAALDPALVARLARMPGVAGVSTYRNVEVEQGSARIRLTAVSLDPRGRETFEFREGDARNVWPAFEAGLAVIVSEPFSYRNGIGVGSDITLRTERGSVSFPVVGVYADYGSDQGVVMISRAAYDRLYDDPILTSAAFFAEPGVDADALVAAFRSEVAGEETAVLVRSNRSLREASLEVFDRTFAITVVLRILAFIVAFIGVLSALMALQLERAREIGVLRATGMTPGQVGGLVTTQTGLMGLVAGLLSLPVGIVLALVMIHVINRRSFGWTLSMALSPEVLVQAVALAIGAALLAGLFPAWRLASTPPAVALREE